MIRISAMRLLAIGQGRSLLAAMLVLGTPAMAQDAPPQPRMIAPAAATIANPQPDHPAYADLILAIEAAVDKEAVLGNAMAVVGQQLRADPNVGAAEAVSSGLVDEILAGMRPVIDRHNDRVTKDYRPRMMAVMADYLTPEEATVVGEWAVAHGADLIDVSSGGLVAHQRISVFPGYQVPLAETVRQAGRIPVSAVGLITAAQQAEQVLADGAADAIFAGREWLRDPHFALRAAHELGVATRWPPQYERATWR